MKKTYYNNRPSDYTYHEVTYDAPLLEYLVKNIKMSAKLGLSSLYIFNA